MEQIQRNKLSVIVDKLSDSFGFNDNDWKKEAFNLLIGSLVTKIRILKEKKYYAAKSKKKKNPLLYWEIGKEIYEFIKRRKNDIQRFGKEFKLKNPYSLISNLIVEAVVEDNKSKWEGFTQKRTFEACYFLYLLDAEKQHIDPNFPWSFYYEFTQQRKLNNLRPKSIRKLIYSEIVKSRKKHYFSDKNNRAILKEILELESTKINKTNISRILQKYIVKETSQTLSGYLDKEIEQVSGVESIKVLLMNEKILASYKKLSRNDVAWAEPKSRSPQAGVRVPRIFFSKENFLPINDKVINDNPNQNVLQSEITILWITKKGKTKLMESNLEYYRSKNKGRITICPKKYFFPKIPDYLILIKKEEEDSFIIYLGEFGDELYRYISEEFQFNTLLRFKILK